MQFISEPCEHLNYNIQIHLYNMYILNMYLCRNVVYIGLYNLFKMNSRVTRYFHKVTSLYRSDITSTSMQVIGWRNY